MRIKGLVRVFNRVRAQLQAGLRPDEVAAFRQQVQATVRDVEEICRQHGMKPDGLPGPSRQAYVFLRELDLDHLPVRQRGEPAAATPPLRISNVVKIGDQLAARIWQQLDALLASSPACTQLAQEMTNQVATIERLCAEHERTPGDLEVPSRQVYCWLKFLLSEDNLSLHLTALERARAALIARPLRPDREVHVHLTNLNALWRRREYRNAVLLKVNEGFLQADEQVWRAVVQNATGEREPAHDQLIQLLREFAASDDFSETLFEIESFAATTQPARGRAHDLDESFARVNAAYFGSRIPKPTLVWNRTLTARKFGHYQPSRDTVMISVSLDDARVPALVIDFVMYHELLHKKHGVMMVNGRRLAHSPAFRADERQFAEYHEAERQLKELALRQRGMSELMTAESEKDVHQTSVAAVEAADWWETEGDKEWDKGQP